MSFSKKIKSELAKTKLSKNNELIKYELLGYVISNITFISSGMIQFTNENIDILERYKYILYRICNLEITITQSNSEIFLNKKLYEINIYNDDIKILCNKLEISIEELKNVNIEKEQLKNEKKECIISFIRGIFLGGGYLSNPKGNYHLEIYINSINIYKMVLDLLNEYEIHTNITNKKNKNVIYITDGESISNFLALIGANVGVIDFEQTRVMKSINNNMNRVLNCETANFSKTIIAAQQQIDDIEYIKNKGKYETLTQVLKDTCVTRLENAELSLVEIANMLGISKSGLNNRIKKIQELAKTLREKEEKNEDI